MDCVSIAVIKDDEIFMQHRDNKNNIKYPLYWALPGGGIETNESVITALLREFKEEIDIEYIDDYARFKYIGSIINEWGGNEYIFITRIYNQNSIYCKEGLGGRFFQLSNLLDISLKIPPHHREILKIVKNYCESNHNNYVMEDLIMDNVRSYVSITKLGTEKNPQEYQDTGKGYLVKKGNALTALYHNGAPMHCLAYIEFESGKTRGDHYHYKKEENMCVVKGTIHAKYMLPNNPNDVLDVKLSAGDIVHILPGCAHSYLSEEGAIALEFSPQKFEIADTVDIDFCW